MIVKTIIARPDFLITLTAEEAQHLRHFLAHNLSSPAGCPLTKEVRATADHLRILINEKFSKLLD